MIDTRLSQTSRTAREHLDNSIKGKGKPSFVDDDIREVPT